MASCDVCGALASRAKNPVFPADEFRQLVANGFGPEPATVARWAAEQGVSEAAALVAWQGKVAQTSSEWLLCASCAERTAPYRKRPGKARSWWPMVAGVVAVGVIVLIALLIVNAPKSKARSLKPHELAVVTTNAVAFSPDSRTVAGATTDKLVKLWDVASGKDLNTLTGHAQRVTAVAFSPDGKLLASGSQDRTIKLWGTAAMRGEGSKPAEALTLRGHNLGVSSVAFSPDGGWLASGSYGGTVKLWDVRAGDAPAVRTVAADASDVNGLAFAPDGALLATAGQDGKITLWDVPALLGAGDDAATPTRVLDGPASGSTSVAFSPDGLLLAAGGRDGTVKVWDVRKALTSEDRAAALLRTLTGHAKAVTGVAFTPDGQLLASSSDDGTVKLWQRESGQLLRTLVGYEREMYPATSVAVSPDGRWLADGNEFDTKLWDLRSVQ